MAAAKDVDVRVVTITGSGRSFCSGGDHRYIETLTGPSEGVADFGFSEKVILGLQRMGKGSRLLPRRDSRCFGGSKGGSITGTY